MSQEITVETIQLKRGLAANWTAANPILEEGEPGFELDTGKIKIGNGVDPWTVLPYRFTGGVGGGAVTSVFGRTDDVTAQIGDYTFAQIGSKPTTLAGYGITDAQPHSANLDAWSAIGTASKQNALGFTPENVANKDTDGTLSADSDTKYPSQKAVKTYADTKQAHSANLDSWSGLAPSAKQDHSANLDSWSGLATSAKQDALGFTPENVANKRTTFQVTPDDTHYPSEKLVKDSLDAKQAHSANLDSWSGLATSAKQDALGFTPVPDTRTVNGHALSSNVTVSKGDVGLGNVDNTSDATKNSATATLANKRITKRTGTTASSATPTINTDNVDFYSITALAVDITSFTTNLSGTPTEGQTLWIAITDNGTPRAIAWGASFEASTIALPTTTVASTRLDVGFVWNTATSKWRCVAVA